MAVTVTVSELETLTGADTATATRLLSLATELVTRYVNNTATPESILNESVIRLSGWLHNSPPSRTNELSIGADISIRVSVSHNAALRHSGAMSLLSPYKKRRASPIKGD